MNERRIRRSNGFTAVDEPPVALLTERLAGFALGLLLGCETKPMEMLHVSLLPQAIDMLHRRQDTNGCNTLLFSGPVTKVGWGLLKRQTPSKVRQLYRRRSHNRGGGGRSMAPVGEYLLLLLSNQLCRMPRASGAHRQVCCRSPGTD